MRIIKKVIGKIKNVLGIKIPQHMLDLSKLVEQFDMHIKGVIVVGAHYFTEHSDYLKLGVEQFVLIEPGHDAWAHLYRNYSWSPNYQLFSCACGSKEGTAQMNTETANYGQSNSLLEPAEHLKTHPDITFDNTQPVRVQRLDDMTFMRSLYNFISIDTQGFELEVLKGAKETLKHIDYIFCEVNKAGANMYKDAATIEEIDACLGDHGFERVAGPIWVKDAYGDALYIKQK